MTATTTITVTQGWTSGAKFTASAAGAVAFSVPPLGISVHAWAAENDTRPRLG